MALYTGKIISESSGRDLHLHRSEQKQETGLTKNRGKEKNGNNIL